MERWLYLKERFENKTLKNIQASKESLHEIVNDQITPENIINIAKSEFYIKIFKPVLIHNWYNGAVRLSHLLRLYFF